MNTVLTYFNTASNGINYTYGKKCFQRKKFDKNKKN